MLDSHCHLNDVGLFEKRAEVIKNAKEAGVSLMVCIGWDLESSRKAIQIAHEFEGSMLPLAFTQKILKA